MKRLLVALPLLLATACATTTQLISEPPGADVYDKNGAKLGTTPMSFESKQWLWETTTVELRKGGSKQTVELKRNEIDLMPTLGAVALTLCLSPTGILWVSGPVLFLAAGMKFPAETTVKLEGGAGGDLPVMACPLAMGY